MDQHSEAFELLHARQRGVPSTLSDDVRRGLTSRPRTIPPKHFYDAAGSAMFDEICTLPEYYLTRAEHRLLELYGADIVARVKPDQLVELGSGMARKTGALLAAMTAHVGRPTYVPFDISPEALEASARVLLREHSSVVVRAVVGDFERDLDRLDTLDRERSNGPHPSTLWLPPSTRLFAFLGSTIGNLDEREAPALLRAVGAHMHTQDAFLLGVDLVKDESVLHAAYNDARGVTARFNRNVLTVVNRELDGNFELAAWGHEASYNAQAARIEMHLVAREAQRVRLRGLSLDVEFEAKERILTEISRKFTRATVEETLRRGGMTLDAWYTGDDGAFALALARYAPKASCRTVSA